MPYWFPWSSDPDPSPDVYMFGLWWDHKAVATIFVECSWSLSPSWSLFPWETPLSCRQDRNWRKEHGTWPHRLSCTAFAIQWENLNIKLFYIFLEISQEAKGTSDTTDAGYIGSSKMNTSVRSWYTNKNKDFLLLFNVYCKLLWCGNALNIL